MSCTVLGLDGQPIPAIVLGDSTADAILADCMGDLDDVVVIGRRRSDGQLTICASVGRAESVLMIEEIKIGMLTGNTTGEPFAFDRA